MSVLWSFISPLLSTSPLHYYIHIKVKWSRYRPGVAQRVGRGIALLFHDRGTRRVVSGQQHAPAALWYWVDSGSNRNEPQEYFWRGGCKVGLCVQLTTLLPSCAGCLEIRQPAPPGNLSRPVMWLLYFYWETHLRYACVPYLLTYSMVQSPSWEDNWFAASQEIPRIFMEPEVSLPHSQASATCPYPGPAQSSPHTHIPPPGDPS
jgi:hypothetical protein